MFDPGTVRLRARVVLSNGIYTFQGAYDGEQEFFEGRPMPGDWRTEQSVTELSPGDDSVAGEVETVALWDNEKSPAGIVSVDKTDAGRGIDGPER